MRILVRLGCFLAAVWLGTGQAGAPLTAADVEPVILGVHPYLSYPELQRRFRPLADYLETALGRPVEVRVGRNYTQHLQCIGRNEVDIAYLGPAIYVKMVEEYGKKPMLGRLEVNGKAEFRGYLVTREGSDINNIEDLRDRRMAFGDPESTMSHLVPRYLLLEAGIDINDLAGYAFLGSHENVALGVLAGAFDAGAVKEEVLSSYAPLGLRAFAQSEPFSEHLFVARSDAPPEFVVQVREAFYRLSETEHGREILNGIKAGTTALVPVDDSDYDNLRKVLEVLRMVGVD